MNTQNIRQLRICCVFNWTVVGRRLATAASTFSLFSFDFLLSLAFFSPSIYIAGHFCPKVHDMNAVAVVCAGIDGLLVCECLTSSIQLRSRWYSHNLFYATQTVKYNILLISVVRLYLLYFSHIFQRAIFVRSSVRSDSFRLRFLAVRLFRLLLFSFLFIFNLRFIYVSLSFARCCFIKRRTNVCFFFSFIFFLFLFFILQ